MASWYHGVLAEKSILERRLLCLPRWCWCLGEARAGQVVAGQADRASRPPSPVILSAVDAEHCDNVSARPPC